MFKIFYFKKTLLSVFFLFIVAEYICADNKIIYFVSPPRSLSVAFLRMMQARGDFQVLHEPSQWVFCSHYYYDITKDVFKPNAPKTFEEVKKMIFSKANESHVFVKEMSFAVKDLLFQDEDFIRNPNIYFVFLLRNPHHSIISFYKKLIVGFENEKNELFDLMGYKACYEIFEHVKNKTVHPPFIVLSEDIYKNPEETIRKYCEALDIAFDEKSLTWQNLGDDCNLQDWHEIKHQEATLHWHGDAIKSTGFGQPSTYEVDKDGKPTFSEVNEKDRELCKNVYEECLIYYNKLLDNTNFLLKR